MKENMISKFSIPVCRKHYNFFSINYPEIIDEDVKITVNNLHCFCECYNYAIFYMTLIFNGKENINIKELNKLVKF